MLPRLPDPSDHAPLMLAIARLAGAKSGKDALLVVPEHFPTCPDWRRISPEDVVPESGLALVLAIDLWSEAADPDASLARLRAALAPQGRLILVQTNWPQRRGYVPPDAGGPARSPDFYALRSALAVVWPDAELALATLDGALALHPLPPAGVMRAPQPGTLEAVAFIASTAPLEAAIAPPPPGLPGHASALAEVSPGIARGARRSLAFVIDVRDWAYANIVDHIAPHLVGRYDVSRFFVADYENRADMIAALFVENRFDHIHFMWRELWFNAIRQPSLLQKVRTQHQLDSDAMADLLAAPVVTTTIYDHLFLTAEEISERSSALALTDGYSTASQLLTDIYRRDFLRPPDGETADGVNTRRFAHGDDNPGRQPGRLRVGWVGNSGWGAGRPGVGEDPKGLHSILQPAIAALQAEGRDVVLELADRNLRQRDRDEMAAYYANEIDVLVCASAFEGTPNPVLEATASGRAWVSTEVGIVREVAGPVQAGLILPERSPQAMANALRRLLDEPGLLAAAEAENRARASTIDWSVRVSDWTRLLAVAEARHAASGRLLRSETLSARLTAFDLIAADTSGARMNSSAKGMQLEAEARIAGLEAWLDSALGEISSRDAWIAALRQRITDLDGFTATMQARTVELEDWGGTMQTRTMELEAWTGSMQARITELEDWNGTAQARITELEAALCARMQGGSSDRLRAALAPRRVLRAIRRRLGTGGTGE